MTDGLYWVVGCVDNGEEGGQDPEQDGGGHQGDGGDVQLVQQERSLPKHCPSEDNWISLTPTELSSALTELAWS